MEPVLSQTEGLGFLCIFGLAMIALTGWIGRGQRKDRSEFLVAGRSLGVWPAALSIAASWIWAPALFVASQKAYDQGLPGVFWFTFPNVLSLVFFAPLAFRLRKLFPAGFTLPQLMLRRHGRAVHVLYLIQFFGLQICSFAVQILAGAVLIQSLTGLPFVVVALILVVTALIYSTQCCPGKVTPTDGKSLPLNVLWSVLPGNDLKSRGRKWPPERSIPTRHNGG